jgi:hypothetical protein
VCGMDSVGSGLGPVAGSCESGGKPSDSVRTELVMLVCKPLKDAFLVGSVHWKATTVTVQHKRSQTYEYICSSRGIRNWCSSLSAAKTDHAMVGMSVVLSSVLFPNKCFK